MNDEWLGIDPLGKKVEDLRAWGNQPGRMEMQGDGRHKWKPHPKGDLARTLYFVPDPWNDSDTRHLVICGRSWRKDENAPWTDEVRIQAEGGAVKVMDYLELAGYRDRAHWRFVSESLEQRKIVAMNNLEHLKSLIRDIGRQMV